MVNKPICSGWKACERNGDNREDNESGAEESQRIDNCLLVHKHGVLGITIGVCRGDVDV